MSDPGEMRVDYCVFDVARNAELNDCGSCSWVIGDLYHGTEILPVSYSGKQGCENADSRERVR